VNAAIKKSDSIIWQATLDVFVFHIFMQDGVGSNPILQNLSN